MQNQTDQKTMKMLQQTARLVLVLALIAASVTALSEVKTMEDPATMEPVKSVLDHYLTIQKELTKDSIKGVEDHANAIAKAVKGDTMKMLPAELAIQAEKLANAKDLKAAREADKPLSASLIKYLSDNKAGKGVYHEAYCPMAKASWLQTDKVIRNPYMGKAMLECGELKN